MIDHINYILFFFLWYNKPNKIKTSVITKQYSERGLQMIENAYIDALKSTWIRQIFTSTCKWQKLLNTDIELDKLGGCNVRYAESVLTNKQNKFWMDVLRAYININMNNSIKEDMIVQTPIFYNENIKIWRSYMFCKARYKKGIRFLIDLINESRKFYSHVEYQEITGINSNTLQYHGTINAIKEYLKDIKLNITHKMKNLLIPSQVQPFMKENKGFKTM